uniref:Uncharacterized protein n=1 Tax=Meloidogyne enterolobii TaxID=390850 RepID=A0A6V7X5X7_MELEN|nr:unnamed protein product [Meloidogyne enterolobii]
MTASNSTSGPTLGLADVERIWGTTPLDDGVAISSDTLSKAKIFDGRTAVADMTKTSISTSGFAHSAFSQHLREYELEKTLQTREALIEEEQQKLREKEEQLRRDEEERSERERKMQEMEEVLKRKQNELNRIAREKDDEFDKRCQQMAEYERKKREELAALEQRILNEQQMRQLRMEEEDRRRAKELQEILSREKERQRHMLEAETKRKLEEEEARMNLALQAAQHTKELEQEQAKKADEEHRRRLIKEQQRQQQQAFEEAHAERIRQQEIAARAEATAKAEQQRIKDRYAEQQTADQQHAAKMNIVPPVTHNQQQTSATNKTLSTTSDRERRGWQQVQMPKPAPIPPVIGKASGGANAGITNQQQQSVGAKKHSQQKKVNDTKTKSPKQQPVVADKFTQWIINRVKELNSSVDAEVFANFIAQVDSPDEAEDYIIGYLGDNKIIKDFHREFLNKRIELRPRVQQPRKDDLSGPAAALTADVAEHSKSVNTALTHSKQSVTMTANNASSVKKKKQKQQKVLDPATLGFRAVPDPNRVNAGEIDSVPPALPGTNRKR